MRQIRIQRKSRPSARPGDTPADVLPTAPVSDTSKAADVVRRIDALVA
jgi:hypothetical protein